MTEGITTKLSNDLASIHSLSDEDIEQLHLLIIDFFAASFAGYKQNKLFNKALESVVFSQGGAEESYVLFEKKKYPARTAAFMNSVYGHGAELDDGNRNAAGHAGVHLIPAVFALADKRKSSYDDVMDALATGYEAYIRISSAAQPGMIQRGFHSTGTAGTLACAAACAKLYHLDTEGIENAIALATTMSGGLLSYGDSAPAIKPINPGKAAENGMFAAMLSHNGVKGPKEALEGPNGWFHAMTDHFNECDLKGMDHMLMHDCYFKLYPSCRHTHCGIDAAVALHKRVNPEDIKAVNVYIYPSAIKLAGISMPKNQDETKFSIPYTLACAFINGTYGIADMNPSGMTRETEELIEKINLIPEPGMEDRDKGIRGTRVEVIKKDGEAVNETVLIPKGDPGNPLTREDIIRKLQLCAAELVNEEKQKELIEIIIKMEGHEVFFNPVALLC